MTDITNAILAIKSDAWVGVSSDDVNKITWHDGNPTNITKEQILAKQTELQAEFETKQYQRDRTQRPQDGGYPSIGDQLDNIYHDQVNGTTTFKDAIKVVKDANPKGGS